MSTEYGQMTRSLWMETPPPPSRSLTENVECNVLIIGAGIAGLTTGYFLAKAGKKVVIVERNHIGAGQTAYTTAHLTNAFDDRYFEMAKLHGKEKTKLLADSHTRAIDIVEAICQEEKIECDFRRLPGYLFASDKEGEEILEEELKAATEAGIGGLQHVPMLPFSLMNEPAILFPHQGEIHPLKYLFGLAQAFIREGGRVYEESPVTIIKEEESIEVTVNDTYKVKSKAVVVATNSPIVEGLSVHAKQLPFCSYVIGLEVSGPTLPHFLAWDTLDPYHYVRLEENILIVGGEDHPTGEEEVDVKERYIRLEEWARARFQGFGKVSYRWSGQVMEPVDGVAFIGKNPGSSGHVYIITGDSGNGMTHGTLGGRLIADLLLGQSNPWATLYDPSRITPKAALEYMKAGLQTTGGKFGKRLTGGERSSEAEIGKGEGTVLKKGTKKIAVYRDKAGRYYHSSALCTHMGCVVAWNSGEKTWDCPCHGSRFTAKGKVFEGPAVYDLNVVDKKIDK